MQCLIGIATLLVTTASLVAAQDLKDQLRLKPGNYWVYSGTVEWTYINTTPPRFGKKHIRWKTEILEESIRGDLKAFLVRGSLFDLAWYEPDTEPSQHFWILYRDRFFSIASDAQMLARFHDTKDSLVDLVLDQDPLLQVPLRLGRCTLAIKPPEPRQRPDLRYCWYLESRRRQTFKATGIPHNLNTVWSARYQTLPEHEILGFSPGVGFVSFDFSHHGTLAEAHVKLIEAHLQ